MIFNHVYNRKLFHIYLNEIIQKCKIMTYGETEITQSNDKQAAIIAQTIVSLNDSQIGKY